MMREGMAKSAQEPFSARPAWGLKSVWEKRVERGGSWRTPSGLIRQCSVGWRWVKK
jgi:hypothetical protein